MSGRGRQRSLFATDGDDGGGDDVGDVGDGDTLAMPDRAERDALFQRMDFNGNGMLSLAEIDKAIITLWPQFDHKRALMRAYKAADRNGDGFIKRREFRLLLKYIIYFNEMWDHFEQIDVDGDHRMSPSEFVSGCSLMHIRMSRADAAAEFAAMDENGGGFVMFDEFCHWCARRQVPADEGEELTLEEAEELGGPGGKAGGPPLPQRDRAGFMGEPVRSSRRKNGAVARRAGPMVCYLHRNGETVHPGEGAMLKTNPSQCPDFHKFLDDVTAKLGLTTYAKKLFRPDGSEVRTLEELRPKEDYVASSQLDFMAPKLAPKHKVARWNSASPGRGARSARSPARGGASPARGAARSPRRGTASPGRGGDASLGSRSGVRRAGSAGRSRQAAEPTLAEKRRAILESRAGGGSPGRSAARSPGRSSSASRGGRPSSPAQMQNEVRRLQTALEREMAEQKALEKRLRQLDEAEARAERAAEKQAMRIAQDEERRLASEERSLGQQEATLLREREDWERDRTPPPRMSAGPPPPGPREEHEAVAKLQANYRGFATRRDLASLGAIRAEREALEQQAMFEQEQLESGMGAYSPSSRALDLAPAPEPAGRGETSAVTKARQRRQAKAAAGSSSAGGGIGGASQKKPKELHYALSLDTPSQRVAVSEFANGLATGAIPSTGVVVWTKGMGSWKLPSDALDALPELRPALAAAAAVAAGPTGPMAAAAGAGSRSGELRQRELQGMRVMALYKRCAAEGIVDEEELEDAMEDQSEGGPKERLIELLMETSQHYM